MVTASKVAAASAVAEKGDTQIRRRLGMQESSEFMDTDSELSSNPPPEFLPFGEQLVLETYMRYQRRPYDRQRQEELARPKRHGGSAIAQNMLLAPPTKTASPGEIAGIVGRLTAPKKSSAAAAAETSLGMANPQAQNRRKDFNIDEMVSRLTAPRRVVQPTPAEEVVMQSHRAGPRRAPDSARLAEMAQPHRRGASCRAWGVNPDWVKDISSCLDTPRSSRSLDTTGSRFHTLGANIVATPRTPSTGDTTAPPRPVGSGQPGGGMPMSAQDYAPRQQQQQPQRQPQWDQLPLEPDSPQNGPPVPWKQPQNAAWEMHLQQQEEQREAERQQRQQRREQQQQQLEQQQRQLVQQRQLEQPVQPQSESEPHFFHEHYPVSPNGPSDVEEEDQALLRLLMQDVPLDEESPAVQTQADDTWLPASSDSRQERPHSSGYPQPADPSPVVAPSVSDPAASPQLPPIHPPPQEQQWQEQLSQERLPLEDDDWREDQPREEGDEQTGGLGIGGAPAERQQDEWRSADFDRLPPLAPPEPDRLPTVDMTMEGSQSVDDWADASPLTSPAAAKSTGADEDWALADDGAEDPRSPDDELDVLFSSW